MANRFPLIVDSSSQQIKELPDGDSLLLGDNEKLIIGDGLDATIFSDGSNGYMRGFAAFQNKAGGKDYIAFADGGATSLYFNNAVKLATTATGVDLTGALGCDGLSMGDSEIGKFGTSNDLQIYHNATDSFIDNATGDLKLRTPNNFRVTDLSNNKMILCQDGGETQLYHDGSEKLNTTSTGAIVTGYLTATTGANISQVALTSSSNAVAWDALLAANAYHVTTENTTFAAPSNAIEGAIISVEIAQGGTARTIAWNTVFEFAASTAPTITATANKTDILAFRYNGAVWQEIGRVQNLAQT